jgi:adenylate cyclase
MGDIGSLESRRDYTCIGDNVNKTQRLESLCAPGRILLSQESFSLVRDHINTDKRADLHVKGFKDTVTAYEIIEPVWTPFPPETNKPTE